MGKLCDSIFSGITPKSGGDAYTQEENGVLFIKSGCLSYNSEIKFDEASKIKPEIHNGIMKSSKLKKNDVLVAIVGATIGKIGIFKSEREANINQAIAAIRLKENSNILPEFLVAYLLSNIGQTYLEYLKRPVARANINLQEIASIDIPLLTSNEQLKFIEIFNNSMMKYTLGLRKADELRNTIPDIMADLLDVCLIDTNKEVCNAIKFLEIKKTSTNRIDPKCFSTKYKNLRESIKSSRFKKYKLSDLIIGKLMGGEWGKEPDLVYESYQKCLVLRATEIGNKDNLNIREDKAQFRSVPSKKLQSLDIELGDIIIEKSGGSIDQPVGRVVFVDRLEYEGFPICYSNFLAKIKVNKELVDPYYLFEYLRFIYKIGLTEVMQNQTNGIRNLITEEYLNQIIIVPENNKKIGEKIMQIRKEAIDMENQAERDWQQARKQFEKELLGE